ncbi:amidohydrolase family protein [Dermacoccaceae bacterium W4C1]
MSWLGDETPTPWAPGNGRLLLRGATVYDGSSTPPAPASLLIDGEYVTSVFPAGSEPELDAETVDLDGAFIIPGLVDTHQHLATPPNRVAAEQVLRRLVFSGVTTIRDMADDLRQVADLARATLVGETPGPDIHYAALTAGPDFFVDPRTWQVSRGAVPGQVPWMQAITSETDLTLAIAQARGTGATAIKIYADLPAELVAALTAEAHRQGLAVWAHATVFPATPADLVAAGADVLSHITMLGYQPMVDTPLSYLDKQRLIPAKVDPDAPEIAAVLARMAQTGTILDATASMWVSAEMQDREHAADSADLAAALVTRAHAAGVPVSAGTDVETPPEAQFPSLFDELDFLHERCGLSTLEVLRAATSIGARSAAADDAGLLAAGKLANLVVLNADPISDLANLRSIRCTYKRGRAYPRSEFMPGLPGAPAL